MRRSVWGGEKRIGMWIRHFLWCEPTLFRELWSVHDMFLCIQISVCMMQVLWRTSTSSFNWGFSRNTGPGVQYCIYLWTDFCDWLKCDICICHWFHAVSSDRCFILNFDITALDKFCLVRRGSNMGPLFKIDLHNICICGICLIASICVHVWFPWLRRCHIWPPRSILDLCLVLISS